VSRDDFNDLLRALMTFCPACGARLSQPAEPASCGACGWAEEEDSGADEREDAE